MMWNRSGLCIRILNGTTHPYLLKVNNQGTGLSAFYMYVSDVHFTSKDTLGLVYNQYTGGHTGFVDIKVISAV